MMMTGFIHSPLTNDYMPSMPSPVHVGRRIIARMAPRSTQASRQQAPATLDIWRAWPTPKASIPLGPTTLIVEANLLKRAGGWMGLPQGEDIGMMMAATCMAPGVVIDAYVYHVRLHVGQTTKTTWFDDLELLSRRCARERGEQILFEPPPEIRRFDPSFLSGDQPG